MDVTNENPLSQPTLSLSTYKLLTPPEPVLAKARSRIQTWLAVCAKFRDCGRRVQVTSLIRKRLPLGPYSSPMPRGLGLSWGGGVLMSEVPLTDARVHTLI